MKLEYSVVVKWSDEDQAYLVFIPEFGPHQLTHGDNYRQAFKHALEVMETLVDAYQEDGRPLPKPRKYGSNQVQSKRATAKSA